VGAAFPAVATSTALPAAAANAGKSYWVTDTAVIVISDGTRWRTVYGDTGMRNVNALLTDASIVQSAPVPIGRLRRCNNLVELYIDAKWSAAPINPIPMLTLPVGFRPVSDPTPMNGPMYGYNKLLPIVFGPTQMYLYNPVAGAQDRMRGTWTTQDAWPATLPGTAVGVPN
jgi:hypothetical protein